MGHPASVLKDLFFVVDLLAHDGRAGDEEFTISVRATPFVTADRWVVRKVLLGALLVLRSSAPGETLRVAVGIDDYEAVVTVGHPRAIAPDLLARLRSSLGPLTRADGGLLEAASLVRSVGGVLLLESERERGTNVTIRLPLAASRPQRPTTTPGQGDDAWTRAERTSPCA